MRIVVNDIAASKTGALSVLKDFYNYIVENDKENEWIFILGDKYLEERDNIKILVRSDVKANRVKRLMFDYFSGAGYLKSLNPDVVFSLQNTLPNGYRGKQVLYVHQPLGYQKWKKFSFFKPYEREYAVYQQLISRVIDKSVKNADRIIVQTEWMKAAVIEKTGISADRIVKIMPDIIINNNVMNNAVIDKDKVCNNRFFYPAGNILYKNHAIVLDAVDILTERGITDFKVSFTLNEGEAAFLKDYPLREQVEYLGSIDRDEVIKKYREEILLFPSYIETFGYPPAEARAVGGVVFASDCDFCHEVLCEYANAYYFDAFNKKELAALMEQAINGKLKYTPVTPLYNNNEAASWGRVIEEILNVARR